MLTHVDIILVWVESKETSHPTYVAFRMEQISRYEECKHELLIPLALQIP
jgi:hypothetical protein